MPIHPDGGGGSVQPPCSPLGIAPSRASVDGGASTPKPALGSLDRNAVLMGAAIAGGPRARRGPTAFCHRMSRPPRSAPRPRRPFRRTPVAFGQFVFQRYTDRDRGMGRRETPLPPSRQPFRGFTPNPLSARITPHGGGLLIGSDPTQPTGHRSSSSSANQGVGSRSSGSPPRGAHPASPGVPAEVLATSYGTGQVADAAVENASHTELFFGILGPDASRRPSPTGTDRSGPASRSSCPRTHRPRCRSSRSTRRPPDNAWLLAQEDSRWVRHRAVPPGAGCLRSRVGPRQSPCHAVRRGVEPTRGSPTSPPRRARHNR